MLIGKLAGYKCLNMHRSIAEKWNADMPVVTLPVACVICRLLKKYHLSLNAGNKSGSY